MQKIKTFSLCMLFLICLSACQKDIVFVEGSGPGGAPPTTTNNSSMSAKVAGRLVNFSTIGAQQSDMLGTMVVAGSSDTENISITIADYQGAKSYDIEKNSVLIFYIKNSGLNQDKDYYIATKGSVNITSVTDKLVSGTFTFTAGNLDMSDEKVITEGKFTSKLVKQ